MNVLVACERSCRVREAFRRRGHNAYSCDLELPDLVGPGHFRTDVRELLGLPWDMVIAFPPCTYLTRAASWRWKATELQIHAAAQLFELLYSSAPKTCVENPPGWLNTHWRKPTQTVQPWWFGDAWSKQTSLWITGLPMLFADAIVTPLTTWVALNSPGSNQRSRRRSLTPPGLARAMAEQWG